VLSGTGLCDDLITRLEESYRLWYVVLCDIENLKNEDGMTRVGSQNHKKMFLRKSKITFEYLSNEVAIEAIQTKMVWRSFVLVPKYPCYF
jgi:hypothetical protein